MTRTSSMILCLFMICVLTTSVTDAKIWYVSNHGNDSNSGNSTVNAFATPSHALSVVNPGDTIYLNGVWCNERLIFNNSGIPGGSTTKLRALPGKHPVLYSDVGHSNWGSQEFGWYGIEIRGQSRIEISGIQMAGYKSDIFLKDASKIKVYDMTHKPYNGYDSSAAFFTYANVTDSSFKNSTCDGCYHDTVMIWGLKNTDGSARYTKNIEVSGNTIVNSTTHNLIDLNDEVDGITIKNNYLDDDDTGTAIWAHNADDDNRNIVIDSNTIEHCQQAVRLINTTNLVVTNNVCYNSIANSMAIYGKYSSYPEVYNYNMTVTNNTFPTSMGILSVVGGQFEYNHLPSGKKCTFVNSISINVHNAYATDFTTGSVNSTVSIVNDY